MTFCICESYLSDNGLPQTVLAIDPVFNSSRPMLPTSARKAPDSSAPSAAALEVEGMSGGSFYGGGGKRNKAEQTPKPDEEEEKKDSKKKEVSSKKKKKALVRQRSASFGRSGEAGDAQISE